MLPIIFSAIGASFCISYYEPVVLKIVGVIICFLASLGVNYLFRPRYRSTCFEDSDFQLEDTFPLEPIKVDEKGNAVYTGKSVTKNGNVYLIFKAVGADNKVKLRRVPKEMTKVIYDSRPEVRLYIATKEIKPDYIVSVFSRTITTVTAEIHTPDAVAALSHDTVF